VPFDLLSLKARRNGALLHFVGRVDGHLFSEELGTETTMVPGGAGQAAAD
jgi:hypothetical protein